MADLNGTYNGFVEQLPTQWQIQVCDVNFIGFCVSGWRDVDVSDDELHRDMKAANGAFNLASKGTVDAVKIPFQTNTDRVAWLKDRLDAINRRVSLIQERVQPLREILTQNGKFDADQSFGILIASIGATFLPVLGTVVNVLKNQISNDNAERLVYAQTIVAKYATDLQELGSIKAQILADYVKANTPPPAPTPTPAPPAEAPNPNAVYYWYAGAVLLVLLLLYWSKPKKRS
jgi:hypothetical protein